MGNLIEYLFYSLQVTENLILDPALFYNRDQFDLQILLHFVYKI